MAGSLSVVIAAHDAAAVIDPCLAALERQRSGCDLQVVVADSSTDATPDLVRTHYPWVTLLHVGEPLTVAELRGRGIAQARGEVIAILDPYSIAAPDWAGEVLRAHASRPHAVIGGVVDLHEADRQPLSAWTLYFNEYGLFMSPAREGETWIVPGSNVSYKRMALFDGDRPRHDVFWKTFTNWELEASGRPPWLAPSMRVSLNKPIPLADYVRTRFDHGRCFGAMRVERASIGRRMLRAATTPLVPLVLIWRWTLGILAKRRHGARYLATLPMQLACFAMWAAGEACGYAAGRGDSCRRLHY